MEKRAVTVITTGGSIDKHYPPDRGSYAFTFGRPAIYAILERARFSTLPVFELCPKDSLDMTKDDRIHIATHCLLASTPAVIVTHGTDTMIESAEEVAATLGPDNSKVIIFVGSSQPESLKDTVRISMWVLLLRPRNASRREYTSP